MNDDERWLRRLLDASHLALAHAHESGSDAQLVAELEAFCGELERRLANLRASVDS